MIRLFISIVVAVFGSLFLIGWGLDKLVDQHENLDAHPDIVIYKKVVEGFAQQLSQIPESNLSSAVESIVQDYEVDASLEDAADIALPATLTSQLSSFGGLMLASDQQPYLLKTIPNHSNYLVKLQLPAEEEEHQLNIILTAVLYIGVCGIILVWLLPLARRLFLLTTAAAKIGKGEQNVRVDLNKFSYIHPLEKSFNQMAAQIEKLMSDNKLLARSLSHDIRTPMSCLRFGVEAALDCNNLEKKNTYLVRMEAELTRMEEMTSAFLSYASMERQGVNLKLEQIEIAHFFEKVCNDFRPLAEQNNVKLSNISKTDDLQITIDQHWMYRAIQNLISNAIHYANSQVTVTYSIVQRQLFIQIEDDGKGINLEKCKVIFDPFVKLDVDRSREQGHFGLGLAICAKVIDWHKGSIYASQSETLNGAKFTISLPL